MPLSGQSLYFHLNHPLRRVSLAGPVVAIDEHPTLWILHLDDGSGALAEVKCPRAAPTNAPYDHWSVARRPGELIRLGTAEWLGRSNSGVDIDMRGVEVGAVVRVEGGLGKFRDNMQVTLEKVQVLQDTPAEVDFWERTAGTWDDVLKRPWSLDEAELQALRDEADGTLKAAQDKAAQEAKLREKEERRRRRREEKEERRRRRYDEKEQRRRRRHEEKQRREKAQTAEKNTVKPLSAGAGHMDAKGAKVDVASRLEHEQPPSERIIFATQETTSMTEGWRAHAGLAAWTASRDFVPESMPTNGSGSNQKSPPQVERKPVEPDDASSSPESQGTASSKRAAAVSTSWAACSADSKRPRQDTSHETEFTASAERSAVVRTAWTACGADSRRPRQDASHATESAARADQEALQSPSTGKAPRASTSEGSESDGKQAAARRRAAVVRAAWAASGPKSRVSRHGASEPAAKVADATGPNKGRPVRDVRANGVSSRTAEDDGERKAHRRAAVVSEAWASSSRKAR